ncbi:hypothetical protein DM02DRAFT_607795 [Periconia macrospinosa]|uniref:Uncharacterized protein n=1 Tax=Periconia macrospinosa TaxID=97972 RepID=A0A2V1EE67_9PLEO|nr:hypothetical protein DM02DRAFT_607795 [Periconia macrospinosa]
MIRRNFMQMRTTNKNHILKYFLSLVLLHIALAYVHSVPMYVAAIKGPRRVAAVH